MLKLKLKCSYCNRQVKELHDSHRCDECEKEYQTVIAGITKRYGGVLQRLAER